ncbi:fibronectin type III domain-containing protein [Marinobacter sp. NSM]|uniref:fibronectin type III domain-containing protein n=1 Tax=Marinobacter sp. NSM TaxID=3458004 RepID=UPI004036751B
MKRVIKMSKAWIASFLLGVLLTGCGGGGSDAGSDANTSGSNTSGNVGSGPSGEQPEPVRAAVLSWSAPSTRVNGDGIAMGELDKYVIRYGQDVENLSGEVIIGEADVYPEMSYTVDNLDSGTWYFTIQVQDKQGLVSEPSAPVSKTIRS